MIYPFLLCYKLPQSMVAENNNRLLVNDSDTAVGTGLSRAVLLVLPGLTHPRSSGICLVYNVLTHVFGCWYW